MPTQLRKAASWLMALTALGYLMAYLRDAGLAALFGTSKVTDAFFAGTFPSMALYSVIISGSFVPALLPIFAREGDSEQGRRLLVSVGRWFMPALLAVTVAGELFASNIVAMLAPGFSGSSLDSAALYLRLSLPMLLFLGPAATAGAVLNYRHNFVIPALGSLAFGGTMLASLALASSWGLWVVALAMVVGAILQLVINLWPLPAPYRRAVLLLSPDYERQDAGEVMRLVAPMLIYMALTQALLLLERLLASSLPGGVLSQMAYATKLYTLPVTVVATSFTTVLFPSLTRQAASADTGDFLSTTRKGLVQLTLLSVPIALCLWIFAPLVVSLAFGRGSFSRDDSLATAHLLSIYGFALVPMSMNVLLARAFYALRATVLPILAGLATVVLYVALAVPMMKIWGAQGLALAMALANAGCSVLLLVALFRRAWGSGIRDQGSGIGSLTIGSDPRLPIPDSLNIRKSEMSYET